MAVHVGVEEGVATVRLDRPEVLNALGPATRTELAAIWCQLAADPAVRCVVLTGTGERAFCVGSDLKAPEGATPSGDGWINGLAMEVPVLCAINGLALGGGLELALACDIRLAAAHAEFALPEVRLGTLAAAGGTQRLPRLVGRSNALRMLLTGDRIGADEALRMGLVSAVWPAAELLPQTQAMARRIAGNAPLSVRAVQRLVAQGSEMPLADALQAERAAFEALRETEDWQEGRAAFQQRRPPRYQGR
jgi:E-phenylitaconyl-CoA hydratase